LKYYTSTAAFRADLVRIANQIDLDFGVALKSAAVELLRRIANDTPVSLYDEDVPGHAAGSWYVSKGSIGHEVLPDGRRSSAEAAYNRAQRISMANPYVVWYIYNRVPYVVWLEYGLYPTGFSRPRDKYRRKRRTVGGFSTQAPEGMMRINVAAFTPTLQRFLKNVLRQRT
jgi:hypothetical protein